jgi:hypothetical protein
MQEIAESVENIFRQLSNLSRPLVQRRRAGLSISHIADQFHRLGLTSPDDLIELYLVSDGTTTGTGDILGEIAFFPGFYWMTLGEAVENYLAFHNDDRWDRSWFPVFASGGGDFYNVNCNSSSDLFGSVVGFMLGFDDHMIEFGSVASMLATIDESFRQGAFFVRDGYLEADYPRMREIRTKVDPVFVPSIAA